jgi:hypothetical protein
MDQREATLIDTHLAHPVRQKHRNAYWLIRQSDDKPFEHIYRQYRGCHAVVFRGFTSGVSGLISFLVPRLIHYAHLVIP